MQLQTWDKLYFCGKLKQILPDKSAGSYIFVEIISWNFKKRWDGFYIEKYQINML